MNIEWLPSVNASCFYAAGQAIADHRVINAQLAEHLRPAVEDLRAAIAAASGDPRQFFAHLIPLSAPNESLQTLASTVLAKAISRTAAESDTPRFASLLGRVKRAALTELPNLDGELVLREAPLRMQWEARGPGLIHALNRVTEPGLLVERAQIALVHPALGGGGLSHWPYNTVTFEAVLTDANSRLPEVLRLGWLLGQLNLDLPRLGERLHRDRLEIVGPLGLIPLILFCGQQVELCNFDADTIALAVRTWLPDIGDSMPVADILLNWSGTYLDSRPSLAAALLALDQMLEGQAPSRERPTPA